MRDKENLANASRKGSFVIGLQPVSVADMCFGAESVNTETENSKSMCGDKIKNGPHAEIKTQ